MVFLCFAFASLWLSSPLQAAQSKTKNDKKTKDAKDSKDAKPATSKKPQDWDGPTKFTEKDGVIEGDWWQGGALGAAYFTGPFASKMAQFETVGRKLADQWGMPYREIHAEDLRPSETDTNTLLLYPDGTARVRFFLMPGGNASKTMCDIAGIDTGAAAKNLPLFVENRKAPKQAFATGMNYIGCCGGCCVATSGYTVPNSLCLHWELWPGKSKNIGPGQHPPFPNVVFDPLLKNHPLYKATQDGTLKNMFFNGGPLALQSDITDTEYFGKYDGGEMPEIVGNWFCVAYRDSKNPQSGRLVITTGHPEVAHPQFLQAMADYACDHLYSVPKVMVELGNPLEAKSGDWQLQYYCVDAGEGGKKMTVTLTGLEDNCDIYVNHELPPTFKKCDTKSTQNGKTDEKALILKTQPGVYYIGVYGRHNLLNGAAYTLTVTME